MVQDDAMQAISFKKLSCTDRKDRPNSAQMSILTFHTILSTK